MSIRLPRTSLPLLGLWCVFFLNGAVLASWAPRIPEVKSGLGLSDGALGLALFGVAAGSVPALLGTGRLLRHVGSTPVCVVSAALFAGGLSLIAAAEDAVSLGGTLALLGGASGALDVAMNTAAVQHQRSRRSPVLSRLHGAYSLGVLAGAGTGSLAVLAAVPVGTHLAMVTVVLLTLLGLAALQLPRTDGPPRPASPARGRHRGVAMPIAALAVAGLLLEGSATDWSALLISRDSGGGDAVGSAAVVAFSVAMFVSRSAGDAVVARVGRSRYLLGASTVTALASVALLADVGWRLPVAALVVIGLAIGPAFPVAISVAAERDPDAVPAATAAVSAVGYLAYLGGPPAVGTAADAVGLPLTLAACGVLCATALAAAAPSVSRS